MTKLTDINGIGNTYAKKLEAAGLKTAEAFVQKGKTATGRESMAAQTGISLTLIEKWLENTDVEPPKAAKPAPKKEAAPKKAAAKPAPKKEAAKKSAAKPAPKKETAPKAAAKPAPQKKAPARKSAAKPAPKKEAAAPKKADPAKEAEAIRAVIDTESDAILSHDLDRLASVHAPDAVHRSRSGAAWSGWTEISHRYSDIFGHGWHSLSLIDLSIDVDGDRAKATHQGVVINDNPTEDVTVYTLKKIDGRWLITEMEYGG